MVTIYERIDSLCKSRGITGGKMCNDLGISRSTMTELRKGRVTTLKLEKAKKISDYFGVSVDFLLTGEQKEKAPAPEGERQLSDDDLKFALWGDSSEIDDADLDDVKRYAAFVRERKKDQKK